MPAYRSIETDYYAGRGGLTAMPGGLLVPVRGGSVPAGVFEGRLPGSAVPVYFIAQRELYDRDNLYGYGDDPYRFAFFSRAALELTLALDWRPDLVHAHDWHSAPALTWLATTGQSDDRFRGMASLFTIHNLAHQGRSGTDLYSYLGFQSPALNEEGFGELNFMARGIHHATLINTVSPTYAREILAPGGGAGLDGLLRYRAYDVHGILNGLDTETWNPATDSRVAARFDASSLDTRLANKRALQTRSGLPARDVPLVAMVSRLDWQKGLDITGHVIHLLLNDYAGPAQFVVLGSGATEWEAMFADLATYHADKMAAFLAYDAPLAQLI
jgi:starch synthase